MTARYFVYRAFYQKNIMQFISTKVHACLDYIVGFFLIVSPWIFKIQPTAIEGLILMAMGILALVYSVFTRYELGIFHILPFSVHLGLDVLSGIVLAASPWLFGFADAIYLPHLLIGLFEVFAGLATKTSPGRKNR